MKTCVIAALIVVLTTSAGFAEEAEFEKVKSDAGRFSIEMPGERQEQRNELKAAKMTLHRLLAIPSTDAAYAVEYFDLNPADLKGKSTPVLLDVYLKGSNMSFEIVTDKKIVLGKSKIPGRERLLKLKDPQRKIYMRDRVFLVGARMYTLSILVIRRDKDELKNADAERFFNSFQINEGRSP